MHEKKRARKLLYQTLSDNFELELHQLLGTDHMGNLYRCGMVINIVVALMCLYQDVHITVVVVLINTRIIIIL